MLEASYVYGGFTRRSYPESKQQPAHTRSTRATRRARHGHSAQAQATVAGTRTQKSLKQMEKKESVLKSVQLYTHVQV